MKKYYVDNRENRKLKRVGKLISKPIYKEKTTLKRGIKVKINLPWGKRVVATYNKIENKKIVVVYKGEEFKLEFNKVNLKIC